MAGRLWMTSPIRILTESFRNGLSILYLNQQSEAYAPYTMAVKIVKQPLATSGVASVTLLEYIRR